MPGTAIALLFSCWVQRKEKMQPIANDSKRSIPSDKAQRDEQETSVSGVAMHSNSFEDCYLALGKCVSTLIRDEVQRILQPQSAFREEETTDEEDLRDIIRSQDEKIVCLERIIADLKSMLQRDEFEEIDLSQSNDKTHPHSQMKS